MSGQHWENYDVKREIVHYYPRNVDRCCTRPDVVTGISAHFSKFAFVLFCYLTNHLMIRISMFPSTSSWETLRFSGNKIHCFPRDQSVSVKYYNHSHITVTVYIRDTTSPANLLQKQTSKSTKVEITNLK